jgi:hypothetical protein
MEKGQTISSFFWYYTVFGEHIPFFIGVPLMLPHLIFPPEEQQVVGQRETARCAAVHLCHT